MESIGNNPLRRGELWILGGKKRRGVGEKCVWEDFAPSITLAQDSASALSLRTEMDLGYFAKGSFGSALSLLFFFIYFNRGKAQEAVTGKTLRLRTSPYLCCPTVNIKQNGVRGKKQGTKTTKGRKSEIWDFNDSNGSIPVLLLAEMVLKICFP